VLGTPPLFDAMQRSSFTDHSIASWRELQARWRPGAARIILDPIIQSMMNRPGRDFQEEGIAEPSVREYWGVEVVSITLIGESF
jgi:hypothetical protein